MAQWGSIDRANNSVNYGTELLSAGPVGSNNDNKSSNNTALYGNTTVGAFANNKAVGQFAVSAAEMANTGGEASKVTHTGWQIRTSGSGPVTSVTPNSAASSGFANGETATISGGTANVTVVLTANATGNLVSGAFSSGGAGFTSDAAVSVDFTREKHLTAITVGGTPTGYANTDTIVAANGTVNATATVSTNSTGGFETANVTITNAGLFANNKTNGQVAFSVLAANGAASNGSGATFSATLGTSTGGGLTVGLGGRANRVFYETIVAGGISTDGTSDDTQLPQ